MSKIKLRLQHGADKVLVPIDPLETFEDLRDTVNRRYDMKAAGFIVDGYQIYLNDQICDMIDDPKVEIVEVLCSSDDHKEADQLLELSIDDHDEPSLDLDDHAPSVKLDELRATLSLQNLEETIKASSPIAKYEAEGDTVPKDVYLELYARVETLQNELSVAREIVKSNLPTPPNTTRELTAQALEEKARECAKKPYVTIMMPKRHSFSDTDHLSTMVQVDGSEQDPDALEQVTEGKEENSRQNVPQNIGEDIAKMEPKSLIKVENGDEPEPKEIVNESEQSESKQSLEEALEEEGSREIQDIELKMQAEVSGDEISTNDISPKQEQEANEDKKAEPGEEAAVNNISQAKEEDEYDDSQIGSDEIKIDSGAELKNEERDESIKESNLNKEEAEAKEPDAEAKEPEAEAKEPEAEAKEPELNEAELKAALEREAEEKEAELKAALEREAEDAEKKEEEERKIRKRREKIRQKMADRLVKRKGPRMKLEKLQEHAKVLEASTKEKKPKMELSLSMDSAHSGGSPRRKKQSPRAAIAARMAERMKHRKEPRKTHLPPKPEPKPKKKKRAPSPQPFFIDGSMSQKEIKRIRRLNIDLGDKLEIHGHKEGIVKYIGNTDFSKGIVFGLELCDGSLGKNSGTVFGKTYFKCKENRGVFIASSEIRKKVKELRIEPRRDVYRRRIVKIFETFNPEKVANVDRLLDKYMGEEHSLYEQICKKYFVSPENEYKE